MFNSLKPLYPLFFSSLENYPEEAHLQLLRTLNLLDNSRHQPLVNWLKNQLEKSFCYQDKRLSQQLWGLNFSNPIGLAPGFDKDGVAVNMWASFGFGFAELGAVTLHSQHGNPRPRLFRLPLDQAALNRMGANNLGSKVMANTLQKSYQISPRTIPIGINLCKSKITPLETAASDYLGSFKYLQEWADYFVINVSSPNTPGLRSLQAESELKPILESLQEANQEQKPIMLKIAPDLDNQAIATITELAKTYQLAALIATNTTIRRDHLQTKILPATGKPIAEEAGGISGKPLQARSTEVIRLCRQYSQGEIPIIGVGGIFTTQDAWEKITAGACLLQLYTGWIYHGPWLIPELLSGLVAKLEQHGLTHISQAVGRNDLI